MLYDYPAEYGRVICEVCGKRFIGLTSDERCTDCEGL